MSAQGHTLICFGNTYKWKLSKQNTTENFKGHKIPGDLGRVRGTVYTLENVEHLHG